MSSTTTDLKIAAVAAMMEGSSLSAVSRMTGISRTRLGRLVLQMGRASERLMDEKIRGFQPSQIECDELWTFVQKRRNRRVAGDGPEVGDTWIWSGIDPDSKLIPAHHVGKRGLADAHAFARQLRRRITGRVQLNTDRLHAYRSAFFGEFSERDPSGLWIRPDWGTIVKHYEVETTGEGRYQPPRCVAVDKRIESGNPDPDRMTTSHVESHHLHFRMRNRRAARLGNGYSKSLAHLRAATAGYFAHYNFVRRHSTIKTTPAVAAGLVQNPLTLGEFVEWIDTYGR